MENIPIYICTCLKESHNIYSLLAKIEYATSIDCPYCSPKKPFTGEFPISVYRPFEYYLRITDEIKRFIIKNPIKNGVCIYFIENPKNCIDRLYKLFEISLKYKYASIEMCNSYTYSIKALDIIRIMIENQFVKIRAYHEITKNKKYEIYSKLPPEIWIYIFEFIDI